MERRTFFQSVMAVVTLSFFRKAKAETKEILFSTDDDRLGLYPDQAWLNLKKYVDHPYHYEGYPNWDVEDLINWLITYVPEEQWDCSRKAIQNDKKSFEKQIFSFKTIDDVVKERLDNPTKWPKGMTRIERKIYCPPWRKGPVNLKLCNQKIDIGYYIQTGEFRERLTAVYPKTEVNN